MQHQTQSWAGPQITYKKIEEVKTVKQNNVIKEYLKRMRDEDKMDCCYRTEPAGGGIQREKGNIKSEQKDRNKIR